jgi:DNA-binding NarL/FixJ family response regulator
VSNCSSHRQGGIRVLVVDSSRIGSQLLAASLKRDHFDIVYAGASSQETLNVTARHQVDVALISAILETQGCKGYDIASQIRISNPFVKVILLVENSDPDSVVKAFRAGARGVFARDNALELLSKCVTRVHQGQVWATSDELRYVLEALLAPPRLRLVNANGAELLAPREQEVVHWVSEGLTNREIADQLGLSENTIKNYIFRIFDKLGISKRVELLIYAASQFGPTSSSPPQFDPATAFNDDATLFRWCSEATNRFALNQYALAEIYRNGRGVERDNDTALMWFMIAEHLSEDLAYKSRIAIQELQTTMSVDQIAEAKSRATQWLSKHRQNLSLFDSRRVEQAA